METPLTAVVVDEPQPDTPTVDEQNTISVTVKNGTNAAAVAEMVDRVIGSHLSPALTGATENAEAIKDPIDAGVNADAIVAAVVAEDESEANVRDLPLRAVSATAAIAAEYLPLVRAVAQSVQAGPPEARARAQMTSQKIPAGGMVAVIPLQGVITPRGSLLSRLYGMGAGGLEGFRESFRQAIADPEVTAIVIDVDSPGGLIDMVPETAAEVRAARGNGKRIVAVANTMAASAAYWIAAQADELVVTPSGQVGSVGVFTVHEDYSEMEKRMGIAVTVISAGRFKAEGLEGPLSRNALQSLQSNVDDIYSMFVADVAAGRNVKPQAVTAGYGEGRCVLAERARPLGMVDSIETLEQVIVRLGGSVIDEEDEDNEPDPDDMGDGDVDVARAESGQPADRLYGEVGHEQPSWLL